MCKQVLISFSVHVRKYTWPYLIVFGKEHWTNSICFALYGYLQHFYDYFCSKWSDVFFVLELKNKCHKKLATRPRKPETKGTYGFPGVYIYIYINTYAYIYMNTYIKNIHTHIYIHTVHTYIAYLCVYIYIYTAQGWENAGTSIYGICNPRAA